MSSIISVRDLTKSFGEINAVDHLTFTVNEKEVYGFLGQNGAGKSTTIRMLLTLIKPSEGTIDIFGLSLKKHRNEILRRIGGIIEKPDMYKYLTAYENLSLFARVSGIKIKHQQLMDQLDQVGLAQRATSKVNTYSQGMKQRLGIAVSLVNNPDLVILDEPLNGLDPQGMADIRNLIIHLSKDLGKTIFISSHLLSEMELVADSLLIIDKGKKIVEGKMNEMLNPATTNVEVETASAEMLYQKLMDTTWKEAFRSLEGKKILLHMKREEVPVFIKELTLLNVPVYSIRPKHSLEDYFLSLTVR
ncbi:MAG TPA: ABC transporter ATP-binding protein [Chitinophagaceae bacterium]|nr:ABC transporter ATP-binding protein [Chitinophagaceae bacterium]